MRDEAMKAVGDVLSISVIVGTLADWLPSVAAIISMVWGMIRIYETDTVQRMIGRR